MKKRSIKTWHKKQLFGKLLTGFLEQIDKKLASGIIYQSKEKGIGYE